MAEHYRTKGVVFKKEDRAEANRSFSVFTEDYGRLEILGKAIRKINSKLRGGIDLFSLSEIEFIQGKNNKTLTDAISIKKFSADDNLKKIKIANQISGVMDNFLKGQEKDAETFDLIKEIFLILDGQSTKNQSFIYFYFLWNFLALQGYKSEVNACAVCKEKLNPYGVYFSNKEGGVICKKCFRLDPKSQKINSDIVKILRLIFKKEWQILSKLKVEKKSFEEFAQMSEDYYLYVLPK